MKALFAAGFFILLLGLGMLDYALMGRDFRYPETQSDEAPPTSAEETEPEEQPFEEPDVGAVIAAQGITTAETDEVGLLRRVVPEEIPVTTHVLLMDQDRLGLLSWLASPDARTHFLALKEALHVSFSPDVRDLRDELQEREGKPSLNVLSFFDPAIGPERFVLVLTGERLYEFRIAEGKDEPMQKLIDTLIQQ